MKINKILLLASPAYTLKSIREINPLPPMGLGYLAAAVKDTGVEIKILDCLVNGWQNEEEAGGDLLRVGLPDKEIEKIIRDFDPDIVGINCQFSRQYKMYHSMFALVKKVKKDCVTIGGGAHVTVCPDEVLKDDSCDYVLRGEAERTFREFIAKLKNNEDLSGIDGLGWKEKGALRINEKETWIEDLDSVPFPAYELMELGKYFGLPASHGLRHKARFNPIVTSRGCPAKCTFCSALRVWGNKYRLRSVENVLREMRLLKDKYGIEELMFEDDNVTASPKRAKELFRAMINEKFGFIWDTPNGVGIWSIDEEMLDLIKQSGCIKLNFPVESGSQYVLDNVIKKPIKLDKVKKLIRYCAKIGLDYGMFMVIGMPGEKISDMWRSFKFASECGCYFPHISVATPYPGTELFNLCKEKGYFAREFTLDDLFISSYLIRTPDWDENTLRKMYSRGVAYLALMQLIHNPFSIFEKMAKYVKDPSLFLKYIKKIK